MRIYVIGPMRGLPKWNFPAFDAAADRLRAAGHAAVNPADLDRAVGVTEETTELPVGFLRKAMKRDLSEICDCDGVALLPGWSRSVCGQVEYALAHALGLMVLDATTLRPIFVHDPID